MVIQTEIINLWQRIALILDDIALLHDQIDSLASTRSISNLTLTLNKDIAEIQRRLTDIEARLTAHSI